MRTGAVPLPALIERLSAGPARIFRLPGGTIAPGAPADVTVIDLQATRTYDPGAGYSMGRNTPFAGRTLTGWAVATFVGGRLVMREGKVLES